MNADPGNPRFQPGRRSLLLSLSLLALASPLLARLSLGRREQPLWISAQGERPGRYGLTWCAPDGAHRTTLSNFRGHGSAPHPLDPESVVMFARRPGTSAIQVNLRSGVIEKRFQAADKRHLFGHGCFSRDGTLLFTSEADITTGRGKIGIRDARSYHLLDEYESHGIGPHQIALLPDGRTLVVANGGILTHPDSGRKKLNLDTMRSRLTYIEVASGRRLDEFGVPEPKASIRHLDVATDGSVVVAMQMQRAAAGHARTVPLGAIHKPGESLSLLGEPTHLIDKMADYAGSVAVNSHTRVAGLTSPRGNLALFWQIDEGRLLGYHPLHDVCGIAVSHDQRHFVLSSSIGQLRFLDAATLQEERALRITRPGTYWDNHLLTVPL